MRSQLERLIAPRSTTAFFAENWGRRPLLADGVDGRLRSVLEPSELDRLLVTTADDPESTRGAYCVRSEQGTTVEYPLTANGSDRRSPAATLRPPCSRFRRCRVDFGPSGPWVPSASPSARTGRATGRPDGADTTTPQGDGSSVRFPFSHHHTWRDPVRGERHPPSRRKEAAFPHPET